MEKSIWFRTRTFISEFWWGGTAWDRWIYWCSFPLWPLLKLLDVEDEVSKKRGWVLPVCLQLLSILVAGVMCIGPTVLFFWAAAAAGHWALLAENMTSLVLRYVLSALLWALGAAWLVASPGTMSACSHERIEGRV